MIEIPKNKQWIQTNRSDVFGNLVATFNVNLTKVLGKLRINRMIQTTFQATDTFLTGVPVGFKVFNGKIWTVAGVNPHVSGALTTNSAFAVDGSSNSPSICDSANSDIETFLGNLYVTAFNVSTGDRLYQNAAGTWSNAPLGAGTASGPHMMCVYATDTPRLYIASAGESKIYSMSSFATDGSTINHSGANTLALSTDQRPTFIKPGSNKIWIGVVSLVGSTLYGGKGYVHEWDGVSTRVTRSYRLEAAGALACVIKDDLPWIMDSNGRLCTYSGGTFKEVARLPVQEKFLLNATSLTNNRFIHPNGMTVVNGKINLLINNVIDDSTTSIGEYCPSGIWEYDEKIGLYHKYSLSYLPVGTNTITDYGQNRIAGAGALADMKISNNSASATGDLLAGATIYTDATTTKTGIFTNDTFETVSGTTGQYATQGAGYIVTAKTETGDILESWGKLWNFYKQFLTASDSLTGKFRTTDTAPIDISMTWVNTTSFTTTTDVTGYVGYEVEVTQGTGSGVCVHIKTVVNNAGTYTVTTDVAVTGVTTGTAKARLQNWTKMGTAQDQTSQQYSFSVDKTSSWVQFKLFFLFAGPNEFEKMLLISAPKQLAK